MADQENLKEKYSKLFWVGKGKAIGCLVDDVRQLPSLKGNW